MLTDTEVMAEALGVVLASEPKTFGKEQAELALRRVSAMVKAKQCDDDTADRVRAELGNHSAIRQWAVKQGFLPAATAGEDARAKAVKIVIARIDKALESADKA
jgi:hypothetical protein